MERGVLIMNPLKLGLIILFHPIQGFQVIKENRDNFSYLPAITILFLIMVMRVIAIYGTHYPMAMLDPRNTKIGTELVRMIFPLLTWVIASYGMTTIMDGKTMLREQFAATSYAMLPYVILTIPITILTHFMGWTDMGLYTNLVVFQWAWVVILFFISLKVMNEYSFKKTIGVALLVIISCVLIWLLLGLFFVLTEQVITFIKDVLIEFRIFYLQ